MEDGGRSRREGGAEERMRLQTDSSSLTSSTSHALAQQRYNQALELEKQLRVLIQSKGSSDPNVRALRSTIREAYEGVILEDHAFAEEHEAESALWRLHYKCIDDFRGRVRKSMQAAAAAATAPVVPMPGAKVTARKEPVFKVLSVFKSFLSESTGFYHDLILKIRAKHGLPSDYSSFSRGEHGVTDSEERIVEVKRVDQSCHRCLIFLGDLARYKEQYGEADSRAHDWSVAAGYYLQAAALWPCGGNPHNQLAVLSTYVGDELLAVYRYFRSLAVETPFLTARDNLILLFEKNRQHYAQLPSNSHDSKVSLVKLDAPRTSDKGKDGKGDRMLPVGDGPLKLAVKDRKQDTGNQISSLSRISEIRKSFRVRFVRLNGILFTRTSLETFSEVYIATVRELEQLLGPDDTSLEAGLGSDHRSGIGTGSAGAAGVLQLVSILVFTVHNVNWGPENHHPTYAEILQRSALFKHAVTAAFECSGRLMRRCGESKDASESPLLPAMLVFMEWLACKPDMAQGSEVDEKQACARAFFWRQCVALLNHLSVISKSGVDMGFSLEGGFSSVGGYADHESTGAVALWEDFELRGFTPLAPAQVVLDFSKRPPRAGLGDKKEKMIRLQRLLAAGKAVVAALDESGKGICYDEDSGEFYMPGELPEKTVKEPKVAVDALTNGIEERVEEKVSSFSSAVKAGKVASTDGWVKPVVVDGDDDVTLANTDVVKEVEGEEDEELIVFKPVVKGGQVAPAVVTSAWIGSHGSEPSPQLKGNAYLEAEGGKGLGQATAESGKLSQVASLTAKTVSSGVTSPTLSPLQQVDILNGLGSAVTTVSHLTPSVLQGSLTSSSVSLHSDGAMSSGPLSSSSAVGVDWLSRIGGATDGYNAPSFGGWNVQNARSLYDNADKLSAAGVIGPPKTGTLSTSSWSSELEALATSGMSGFRHSNSRYGLDNGIPTVSTLSTDLPVQLAITASGSMQSSSLPLSNGLYATGQSTAQFDNLKSSQNGAIGPVYTTVLPTGASKAGPSYQEAELEIANSSPGTRGLSGNTMSGVSRVVNVTSLASAPIGSTSTWTGKDVTAATWVGPSGIRPPPGFGPLPSKPAPSSTLDTQIVRKPRTPPGQGHEGEEQPTDDYGWLDDYSYSKQKRSLQSGFQGPTSLYSADYGIWSSGSMPRSEGAAYAYNGMGAPQPRQATQQYQYESQSSYDAKIHQQMLQRQLYDSQKKYPVEQHYQQQTQYEAAQQQQQHELLLMQQQQQQQQKQQQQLLERQKQQLWYGQYHSRDPFVS